MDIIQTIKTIIDKLRDSNTITAITENNNTITIHTPDTKNIANNDKIEINQKQYKVQNKTTTTFEIAKNTEIKINDTWKALKPYLFIGHPIALANEIQQSNYQYPIIWLNLLYVTQSNNEITSERDIYNIYIITANNYKDWTEVQHYQNIENTLLPIVEKIFDIIIKTKQFYISQENIHNNTLQYSQKKYIINFGKREGLNTINDFTDCLFIENLELEPYKNNC